MEESPLGKSRLSISCKIKNLNIFQIILMLRFEMSHHVGSNPLPRTLETTHQLFCFERESLRDLQLCFVARLICIGQSFAVSIFDNKIGN